MHTTDTPPPVPAAGEPPAHPGRQARPTPGTNNRDAPARGHVLVVDDDPTVAEVVAEYLTRAGYEVARAADGPAALEQYAARRPDLAVLDLMLPGMDGIEVCRRMREQGPVPVIMLTARGDEDDRILGLETGADDYVTKPFSPRELVLRVDSVLRRARTATPSGRSEPLQGAGLVLDPVARRATWEGRVLALTLREFDLLAFLLRHPGRVFTREELMRGVWGWDFGDLSTVTVHVRRLRGKVEADPARPELIRTVWGVGYRLDLPPDPATGTAASAPGIGTASSAPATGTDSDSDSGSGTPS
ncbi:MULTISPECIES: response regulator transcription factor [Streptomyces]|uniref:response regulator transcription factor n=1 Tax=Streptomyces TaxID=1883 RepID=UPI0021A8DE01|nr:response regulator transcription factor [Streptomyces atratus]MCT2543060.1 response regulator transcription factor [Streptomyces atratus]